MLAEIDSRMWLFFQMNYIRLWNRYGLLVGTFRAIPITVFWMVCVIDIVAAPATWTVRVISACIFAVFATPVCGLRVWHHLEVQNKQMLAGKFDQLNTEAARYIRDITVKMFLVGYWISSIVFRLIDCAFRDGSPVAVFADVLALCLSLTCIWTCGVIVLPRVKPEPKEASDTNLAFAG